VVVDFVRGIDFGFLVEGRLILIAFFVATAACVAFTVGGITVF
jgi:hypothetical protein